MSVKQPTEMGLVYEEFPRCLHLLCPVTFQHCYLFLEQILWNCYFNPWLYGSSGEGHNILYVWVQGSS